MPEINLPDAYDSILQSMKSTLENFRIKSEDLVLGENQKLLQWSWLLYDGDSFKMLDIVGGRIMMWVTY